MTTAKLIDGEIDGEILSDHVNPDALARIEEFLAAQPKENKAARGPVPTPMPVSAVKRRRRRVKASRRANRG